MSEIALAPPVKYRRPVGILLLGALAAAAVIWPIGSTGAVRITANVHLPAAPARYQTLDEFARAAIRSSRHSLPARVTVRGRTVTVELHDRGRAGIICLGVQCALLHAGQPAGLVAAGPDARSQLRARIGKGAR